MKSLLDRQGSGKLQGDYWRQPVVRRELPQSRAGCGEHYEQVPQSRASRDEGHERAPLSRATLGEGLGDRAFMHQPQSRVLGEVWHQDRASGHQPQSRVLGGERHQVRASMEQQPAGLGVLGEGERGDGGSYHDDRLLRQQHLGGFGSDPKGWNGSGGGERRGEQRSPDGLRTTNPNTSEVADAHVQNSISGHVGLADRDPTNHW